MNSQFVPTNSSTLRRAAADAVLPDVRHDEQDYALGCECANPALQIECWGDETPAAPLQQFY